MKRLIAPALALMVGATSAACTRSDEPFLLPPPPPAAGEAPAQAAPSPTPTPTAARPAAPGPAPTQGNADQIRAAHVLVMHRDSARVPPGITRSREEARQRAEEVLRRARAGEDFAALARSMSDEPGHEEKAGDLGRFGRGTMVAPFEAAAFALRPGQISDIVETPFGYHVIRRSE